MSEKELRNEVAALRKAAAVLAAAAAVSWRIGSFWEFASQVERAELLEQVG